MSLTFESVRGFLLLAFGFGFVIFWHELGHFLAAKWAGVKVEQFAVGFGHAVFAWRKGLGFRVGSTQKEFRRRIREHLNAQGATAGATAAAAGEGDDEPELTEGEVARGAQALNISETEYRLNWIPLGGYVKMLGQDDLKPNSEAEDPRAYNRQTIGKRMVIVSAGVVMNVILAAIGFMVLFLIGFRVPPATVGSIVPLSPAQQAGGGGFQVGDVIVLIDGKEQYGDWTKVQLNAALSDPDAPTPVVVERNGQRVTLQVRPRRGSGVTKEILGLGIGAAYDLKALDAKEMGPAWQKTREELAKTLVADMRIVEPGDAVVAVNGRPLAEDDFAAFDRALQESQGRPVEVTVRRPDGTQQTHTVRPEFMEPYGDAVLNFAGMLPRVRVIQVGEDSKAYGWIEPGDVVTAVTTGPEKNTKAHPSAEEFRGRVNAAGQSDGLVDVDVLRADGREYEIHNLRTKKISPDSRGLRIGIGYERDRAVVADTLAGSAAARAQVPAGARLVDVAGRGVTAWADVYQALTTWLKDHPAANGADSAPVPVTYETTAGERVAAQLPLSATEATALLGYRFRLPSQVVPFDQPRKAVRHTSSPVTAARWGVTETRDFILQFYLTLRRMVTGDVGVKNMMGPLGIFQAGSGFASKGSDWLIWFLSMISANLAVVNFLPIPIVDGGLFTFLILEKIKGKPLSPKAQAIAQYVGMALLLGVFLFVTYQDIQWWSFRAGK